MLLRLLFSVLLCLALSTPAVAAQVSLKPDTQWIKKELKRLGVSSDFNSTALNNYHQKSFSTVLKLNLLGFLRSHDHMTLVTPQAVKASKAFIKKHRTAIQQAEKRYGVPGEVISALLWIETRHGSLKGTFHVPSVYLHLLQAERPNNKKKLIQIANAENKKGKKLPKKEIQRLIEERTSRKSNWAREQILALATIHKKKLKKISTLKGSFAGAFGLPQFIPSSFLNFAQAADRKKKPNLFTVRDSIESVGHYLKSHGWEKINTDSHIKALMDYNNSRDYAESILEIARLSVKK